MDLKIKGKKALVTGSTAGIGFAIAKALSEEGTQVIVNGRTAERVNKAIAAIQETIPSATVEGIATDLSTAEGAAEVIARYPDLDILVNNLGIFEPKPFEEITDADWTRFIEANVFSGIRLSRHYLSRMKAANWGRILFISSESGIQIPSEMIHYGVTKTMQIALARGLAETTVGTGVTVNTILPGPTASEGVSTFVASMAAQQGVTPEQAEKEFFDTVRPSSLLKRFETPEEIAALTVFIASPLAAGTNGAALRVEGGLLRGIV